MLEGISIYEQELGDKAQLSFQFVLLDKSGLIIDQENHNENLLLLMASIKKLPVAVTLFEKVLRESIDIKKTFLECSSSDISPGRPTNPLDFYFFIPSLYPLKKTIYDLLVAMLKKSDNSATDILLKYIGGVEVVNKTMQDLGLVDHSLTSSCKEMLYEYFRITSPFHIINVWEIMYAFLSGYKLHPTEIGILEQKKDVCSAKMMTELLCILKRSQIDPSLEWLTISANIIFEIMSQCETDSVLRNGLQEYMGEESQFGSKQGGLGGTRNHTGFITYKDGLSVIFCVQTCISSQSITERDKTIIKIIRCALDKLLSDFPENLPHESIYMNY